LFIEENKQLAAFTTFGLSSVARYYFEARSCEDLREALLFAKKRKIDGKLMPFYWVAEATLFSPLL